MQKNISKENTKIRLATVFSGIGAIEEALKQLDYPFEIVFACDNGERYLKESTEDILNIIQESFHSESSQHIPNDISEDMKVEKERKKQEIINQLYEKTKKENLVKKTYLENHNIKNDLWFEDIRFVDGTPFKNKIDIIVGGSPCQSFSTYGNKMGLKDTRGTLFYDYARLLNEISPKCFIFENVTGLLTHDKKKTWEIVQNVFKELNYDIQMKILNAQDFNLPQLRKRVFVVGIRKDLLSNPKFIPFFFPDKQDLTNLVLDENSEKVLSGKYRGEKYLENFNSVDLKYYLGYKGFNFVTLVERNQRRARVNQEIIGCQTANQQFNWIGDFRVEFIDQIKNEERIANIKKDPRIHIGKYEGRDAVARQMTPQELLRLMGFKNFRIPKGIPDKVIWRQTGNSIVVPVLKELLNSLNATNIFDI